MCACGSRVSPMLAQLGTDDAKIDMTPLCGL